MMTDEEVGSGRSRYIQHSLSCRLCAKLPEVRAPKVKPH